jgi:hypothetical protein
VMIMLIRRDIIQTLHTDKDHDMMMYLGLKLDH